MAKQLWTPSREEVQASHMTQFTAYVEQQTGLRFAAYDDLHVFSRTHLDQFWSLVWSYCDLKGNMASEPAYEAGQTFIEATFFEGATLNYAQNLLRNRGKEDAVVFWSESGVRTRLSHAELYDSVSQVRQYFMERQLQKGDRVAAMMPNTPETLIIMLAVTSLGGIWASCSPDFGEQGILDRFGQINPRFFITCDEYIYRMKAHPCLEKVANVLTQLSTVEHVLEVPYTPATENKNKCSPLSALQDVEFMHYEKILEDYAPQEIAFEAFPFNTPLFILFSSGTTGVPKCMVHGAGGTLLQHMKEHQLHSNIKAGDRVFYFTTCGWMMWNWHVSALASGATLLLYDGSPFHPKKDILLTYAAEEKMTFFGTGSKYIDALRKFRMDVKDRLDLSALRTMASTGGPLVEESFEYIYTNLKEDIHLCSISGGSDIISCFVLGNPNSPVYSGQIQCKGLGMDVAVLNDHHQSIVHEKGELVCRSPFPSKPLYFWNDAENKKYKAAYFSHSDQTWMHGDFAMQTPEEGFVIFGRSDAVLNPGGVRIGTAEIYRQVEKHEEVLESLAVGQDWKNDVRIVLFVKLAPGATLDADLNGQLKTSIREGASPRHVPAVILSVEDLPKTKSGKLVEIAVREIIHNRPVKNVHTLANPDCLSYFENIPALQAS